MKKLALAVIALAGASALVACNTGSATYRPQPRYTTSQPQPVYSGPSTTQPTYNPPTYQPATPPPPAPKSGCGASGKCG